MKKTFFKYTLMTFVLMCVCYNSFAQFKNYDKVFDFDEFGFARVCNNYDTENQLVGIVDSIGREIIPLKYYDIYISDSRVAVVVEPSVEGEKGMKALVDLKTGREITTFKYFDVDSFENGLAFAETENGNEFINTQGKTVKRMNIEDAEYKGDGFILKPMDDGVMFVNMEGKPISNQIFKDAYHFDNMWIFPNDGWIQVWLYNTVDSFEDRFSHWLSNKGELLSNDEYLQKIKKESFYIIYDREMNEMVVFSSETGKSLFTFKADEYLDEYFLDFGEKRIIATQRNRNNRHILLDLCGNVLIEPQCFYNDRFHEGLLLIRDENNNDWFIDVNGIKVIDYTGKHACYDCVNTYYGSKPHFCEGLAPYKSNRLVGFLDKTGSVVIPATFKSVGPFVNGCAIVQDASNDLYGMIDKTGKLVLPCKYKSCQYTKSNKAIVTLDNNKQTFVNIPK